MVTIPIKFKEKAVHCFVTFSILLMISDNSLSSFFPRKSSVICRFCFGTHFIGLVLPPLGRTMSGGHRASIARGRGGLLSDEILGIVSEDVMKPYDIREIIARIVDGSKFLEFKPGYGTTLVTGYSYIHGYQVGIIANNGVLFSEAANKGVHFIQLCNKNDTPLLFLQNITGFMVGRKYEHGGIIKDGAKMINAVSNSTVPAITVIIGASYGAGNYAMCGRAFQPRFLFSWPNSKIAVMGVEQLTGVMEIIQKQAKKTDLLKAAKGKIAKAKMTSDIEEQSSAFYATGQLWDDGVIDPRQTRNYLGMCLEVIYNSPFEGTNEYGVFRM